MGNKCVSAHMDKIHDIDVAFRGPEDCLFKVMASVDQSVEAENELSYEKGDILYVLEERPGDLYYAEKQSDDSRGLVAKQNVMRQTGEPQCVIGWHCVKVQEVELLLMKVGLEIGTYVLRPSKGVNTYGLSVRDYDQANDTYHVKHFRIKVLELEGIYYCVNEYRFPDILTLIQFYKNNSIGQTQLRLTKPLAGNYEAPTQFKDIEINRDNLEYMEIVGRGAFGIVHKAKWGRKCIVAVKVLNETFSNSKNRQDFIKEAKIMHKLRHPKIVELLGVCTEPIDHPMAIVLEFMAHKSMKDFLMKPGVKCDLDTMIGFMKDIAEGMVYLETKNIVHRDLRADNVLVSKKLTAKVADFGLTNTINEDDDNKEMGIKKKRFPYKWTAPETTETKIFNSKSDVWSYGIVMYEIVTKGATPYPDYKGREVIQLVKEGYRMPNPAVSDSSIDCPDHIYDLMKLCWHENPETRPTFSCILDTLNTDKVINNN